jgi:hypothetical protein
MLTIAISIGWAWVSSMGNKEIRIATRVPKKGALNAEF